MDKRKEQVKLLKDLAHNKISVEEFIKAVSPKEWLPETKTFLQTRGSNDLFTCNGKRYTRQQIDEWHEPGIERILIIKHPQINE